MATQAITGRIGFLGIAATSSGTSLEVGEIRDWSIAVEQNMIDASSNDSSGWNEHIPGQRSWSVTIGGVYARTDLEQVTLRESLSSAATRYWTVRPTTSASQLWRGTGYVENYSVSGNTNDAVVSDFTIRGTRALVYTT